MRRRRSRRLVSFTIALGAAIAGSVGAAPRARQAASNAPVTFAKDIAPLVFDRCGSCHRPGGPAPFSLLTYAAVRQRATQIAGVTRSRFMPPWKAEPGYGGPFVGQHPLTGVEIETIQRWVDAGTPEGNRAELPPVPRWTDGWQLGKPDLVVTLPDAYTLPADGSDAFRIFVLPLPIDRARYVIGYEFRPGNARVVHHANMRIDRTSTSRRLDEQDPAPGYDGLMARTAEFPDGHFLGWTPGQVAPLLPKGLAWRLDPGTDLVVQLHMRPSGKPETVQPSIGLFFGAEQPVRTPAMLRLGRQNIDIPAGDTRYTVADSFVLPADVEVLAVQPHAHYRAREIEGVATLPDGATRWLIRIKDWDFRWQHVYRYVDPFVLPRGTTVAMRYTYDNSAGNPRNPRHPPQRALWGQRSADEMGDLWLQLLPRTDQDLIALNRAIKPKMLVEDIAGYETMVRADPSDADLHDDLAILYLAFGRNDEAVAQFTASANRRPRSAAAHFNLGTALTLAGKLDVAIEQYQYALRLDPAYANAHNNLADALAARGRVEEAESHYRAALRVNPDYAEAHNNLGNLLVRAGNLDEAVTHLHMALRINPGYAEAHYNLSHAALLRGARDDAIGQLRDALRLKPDWPPALADLAWLMATGPDAWLFADEALRFAERAAALTARADARSLDVLAAAYAAAGQFDRAAEAADAALLLSPAEPLATEIRQRQALYRQHTPYRKQP